MVKSWTNKIQQFNPPLLLTLLFGGFGLAYFLLSGPHWMHHNGDVNYTYLYSGLDYLSLIPSQLNDQPGITVKVLNALVIALVYGIRCFFIDVGLAKDVITHSELYLDAVTLSIFVLLLIAFYRFLKVSYAAISSKSVWLVSALGFFLSYVVLVNLFVNKPEPYLVIAGLLLATLLVKRFIATEHISSLEIAACGLIGILSKVTFAPFLLPLLLVQKSKDLLTRTLPILLVLIVPILIIWQAELIDFWKFIAKTTTHNGAYGTGQSGFYDLTKLVPNLLLILKVNKWLMVVLAVGLLVSFATRSHIKAVVTLFISYILLFVFILKSPSSHYFIACYAILPAYILLAFEKTNIRTNEHYIVYGCLVFLILRTVLFVRTITKVHTSTKEYTPPAYIQSYYTSSKAYASFQANQTQQGRHTAILTELFPTDTFYTDDKELHTMRGLVDIDALKDKTIRVQGTSQVITKDNRFTLLNEEVNGIQRVYTLRVN